MLHPSKPDDTIAIGRVGQHGKNAMTKLILDTENAKWCTGMQQVTIDSVYENFDEQEVMYPQVQRPGITTLGDMKKENFMEDETIIWDTHTWFQLKSQTCSEQNMC